MGEDKGVVKKIRGREKGYRPEEEEEFYERTPALDEATPPQAGWPCPPPWNETPSLESPTAKIPPSEYSFLYL